MLLKRSGPTPPKCGAYHERQKTTTVRRHDQSDRSSNCIAVSGNRCIRSSGHLQTHLVDSGLNMIIRTLAYLLFGYLVACVFTDYAYLDLHLTQWQNLLLYIWVVFWPLVLFVKFIGLVILIVVVTLVIAVIGSMLVARP